jgi:RHS repeat-associated protein
MAHGLIPQPSGPDIIGTFYTIVWPVGVDPGTGTLAHNDPCNPISRVLFAGYYYMPPVAGTNVAPSEPPSEAAYQQPVWQLASSKYRPNLSQSAANVSMTSSRPLTGPGIQLTQTAPPFGTIYGRQPGPNLRGDYYCWNRIYDPSVGRWTSTDPAQSPVSNLWDYVGANPLAATDPSGLLLGLLGRNWIWSKEVREAKEATEAARRKAEENAAKADKALKVAGLHPDCKIEAEIATAYPKDHEFPADAEKKGDEYASDKVGDHRTARSASDFVRILEEQLEANLLRCCNSCIDTLTIYGHCASGFGNKEILSPDQLAAAQRMMCKGATIVSYKCSGGSIGFDDTVTNSDKNIPLLLAGKGGKYVGWSGEVVWGKIPSLDGTRSVYPKGNKHEIEVKAGDTLETLDDRYPRADRPGQGK